MTLRNTSISPPPHLRVNNHSFKCNAPPSWNWYEDRSLGEGVQGERHWRLSWWHWAVAWAQRPRWVTWHILWCAEGIIVFVSVHAVSRAAKLHWSGWRGFKLRGCFRVCVCVYTCVKRDREEGCGINTRIVDSNAPKITNLHLPSG